MTGALPPLAISPAQAELAIDRALRRPHEFEHVPSVVERVCAHARSTPDKLAVVDGDTRYDYRGLVARIARIRTQLVDAGGVPGAVVAVVGPRGADTIATFLALESLGAVYLPLDPRWPEERVATVLRTSGATLLVSHPVEYAAHVKAALRQGVRYRTLAEGPATADELPPSAVDPAQTSYVIFTSGTTGTPKGAAVEHRGMLNHLRAKALDLDLSATDVIAFTAPVVFDISVWQMLIGPLLGAATVVFDEVEMSFPPRLLARLRAEAVTVVELVPTALDWLSSEIRRRGGDLALRWCLSTGEELTPAVARRAMAALGRTRLVNAYGPTECSDDITHHLLIPTDGDGVRLPVGGPIANAVLYLLVATGDAWRAAEPGERGELFVGGICVGRGYVGDERATAAAFHTDVFDPASPTGRLYRTGDLALFRAGVVHYLGRGDRQVKVNGVRLELEEVEMALARHPAVAHCAAVAVESAGRAHLVACYVPAGESDEEAMATFLAESLPAAMIPSRWLRLAELPLTRNGKVDHQALAHHAGQDS
jgi:amino acid adenylation domain-containing protein